jgi:hypothetical protein
MMRRWIEVLAFVLLGHEVYRRVADEVEWRRVSGKVGREFEEMVAQNEKDIAI